MILVDTSVWIDHLRVGEPLLVELLNANRVLIHPFIIGELACGNLNGSPEMRMIAVHRHSGWDAGIQPPRKASTGFPLTRE